MEDLLYLDKYQNNLQINNLENMFQGILLDNILLFTFLFFLLLFVLMLV